MQPPIEDYALLSNCHGAALVSRDGSVDWMCVPRFDSAISDCLALQDDGLFGPLVRIVRCTRGYVDMRMELVVRFDYGSTVPWVTREDGCLALTAGPHTLRLHCEAETHGEDLKTVATFLMQGDVRR